MQRQGQQQAAKETFAATMQAALQQALQQKEARDQAKAAAAAPAAAAAAAAPPPQAKPSWGAAPSHPPSFLQAARGTAAAPPATTERTAAPAAAGAMRASAAKSAPPPPHQRPQQQQRQQVPSATGWAWNGPVPPQPGPAMHVPAGVPAEDSNRSRSTLPKSTPITINNMMDHYDHDDIHNAALEMVGLTGEGRGLSAPLGLKAAGRKYKVCQPELNAYFQSNYESLINEAHERAEAHKQEGKDKRADAATKVNLIGQLAQGIPAAAPAATTTAIGSAVAAKMGVTPRTTTSDTAAKDTGRSSAAYVDAEESELERQLRKAGLDMMKGIGIKQAAAKQPMVSVALLRKYYDEVKRQRRACLMVFELDFVPFEARVLVLVQGVLCVGQGHLVPADIKQMGLDMMKGIGTKQAAAKQPMVSVALLRKYYDEHEEELHELLLAEEAAADRAMPMGTGRLTDDEDDWDAYH